MEMITDQITKGGYKNNQYKAVFQVLNNVNFNEKLISCYMYLVYKATTVITLVILHV